MDEKEWLDGNELSVNIWKKKYCYNNESFDEWLDRVSGKNEDIKQLIRDKKFIFGGRILSNRGLNKGSMANCATLGRVEDSIKGIMKAATQLALSFQAEQGQGVSLTDIRPKGSLIKTKYQSEGIMPFMEVFNTTTQAIQQGGNRRGALLMALDIWHKDAENFIKIKSDLKKINNANLSLEIDDDFMNVVKEYYETGNERVVTITRKYGDSEITYDVCPIKLYKMICDHAYKYAEPCILYTNRLFNYNLMQYVDDYQILSTNACSEEPLIPHGMCVLSSFNLSEYIVNPFTDKAFFDEKTFIKDIGVVVRAMDDVVIENIPKCPLPEQKEVAERWRNFGIGICGLADALVKLKITYGSDDGVSFAKNIMHILFVNSLDYDVKLGQERGNFPGYSDKIWDSDIIKHNLTEEKIDEYKKIGHLRNCSLLSVAPTGSIGTMLGVSTGTEPFFALSYTRTVKSLNGNNNDTVYECNIKALNEYNTVTGKNDIPEYFVTAQNISWKGRVAMQAALQEANDTAISSTVNFRKTATVSDIEQMYLESWKCGCKGMSVYVEGSRDPILSTDTNDKKDCNCSTTLTHSAPKRPKSLPCDVKRFKNGGEKWISCVGLFNNQPYEIFTGLSEKLGLPEYVTKCSILKNKFDKEVLNEETGKYELTKVSRYDLVYSDKNGDIQFIENIGNIFRSEFYNVSKMTSALLRHGMPIEYVISTIKSLDFKDNTINSWKSGVIRTLKGYIKDGEVQGEVCPECGSPIIRENGCKHCSNPECGWSACS